MKKILCLVLAMLMLCTTAVALADSVVEEPEFDRSRLTGSDLYHYDKFTKEWNVQGSYQKEYSDARVIVCLLLFDTYVENSMGPELRIMFFDKEAQAYDTVTAFRAIVGEKIFCWESLEQGTNGSNAFSGEVMKAFCEALLTGEEVAFQIDHTDKYGSSWTATIDPVDSSALSELRAMAQLLIDSNAWSICPINYLFDIVYGATME